MRSSYVISVPVVSLAFIGCTLGGAEQPEGDLGVAVLPQTPPDVFLLVQNGATVASTWNGAITGGSNVEYWVAKQSYSASAARTFVSNGVQSCTTWKNSVCGSAWSGATYYKAVFQQSTLDCASPPTTISPPQNAVSFLASGSYQTALASNPSAPYAWTYVSSNVEYWAMDSLISSSSSSVQSPLANGYASFSDFIKQVCARSPAPTKWFNPYYVPISNFCSGNPC